ncbi:MAG: 50S ribosomal protein L4 [Nanobdellota archaeon]
MKLKIYDTKKTEKGSEELPVQFTEQIRPDLIKRAVRVVQVNRRQPYGAHPRAGLRVSADISRRRQNYRGAYGYGISRVPRKILSRRGTRFNWEGAEIPGTVGGRRAHPPKASKKWSQRMNVKERRKAIRSAISASVIKTLVEKRGHKVPEDYPFVVDESIENVKKTSELVKTLSGYGLDEEMKRASSKKERAGKGRKRGRRYKSRKGPLFVVSGKCDLHRSAANIPGVDVCVVDSLNAEKLAPGSDYGRLTIWSKPAVERMKKESLFL